MYTISFEFGFIHSRLYLFVLESRGKERIPKHLHILALILDSVLHVTYLLFLRGDVKREFSEEVEILSQLGAEGLT